MDGRITRSTAILRRDTRLRSEWVSICSPMRWATADDRHCDPFRAPAPRGPTADSRRNGVVGSWFGGVRSVAGERSVAGQARLAARAVLGSGRLGARSLRPDRHRYPGLDWAVGSLGWPDGTEAGGNGRLAPGGAHGLTRRSGAGNQRLAARAGRSS